MALKKTKPTAIDLFCGAGGITLGLQDAGFDVIRGVDFNEKYAASYRHNFGEKRFLHADLVGLDPSDLMSHHDLERGELDLLAGGPPCQGFSKNVPRSRRSVDDDRNQLVNRFMFFVEQIAPRWVLMENVAEFKNGFESHYTDFVVESFQAMGYDVNYGVLDSSDYGVPQRRRRAFFVASRDGRAPAMPLERLKTSPVRVWDAISDLPSLANGEAWNSGYADAPATPYQKLMRSGSQTLVNHVAKKLSDIQFRRISSLEPGQGLKNLPPELSIKGGYSGAYGRLTKDMICPTITRWVFHPGSGRWGHPVDARILTIREVARVQSFPDSFHFVGSYGDQAGQLGNAVPPLLAKALAEAILKASSELRSAA